MGHAREAGARGEVWLARECGQAAGRDRAAGSVLATSPRHRPGLVLAQELVTQGLDRQLPSAQRAFAYMPTCTARSRVVQAQSARLFTARAEVNLPFALQHQAIIERFGCYPHRNAIPRRASSDEELTFLRQPGSAF